MNPDGDKNALQGIAKDGGTVSRELCERLHSTYCEMTGLHIRLAMGRDRLWFDFAKAGFTLDDLRLVIGYIKKDISKDRAIYRMESLRLLNLIGRLDEFEERLALARAARKQGNLNRPAGLSDTKLPPRVENHREQMEKGAEAMRILREELRRKIAVPNQ